MHILLLLLDCWKNKVELLLPDVISTWMDMRPRESCTVLVNKSNTLYDTKFKMMFYGEVILVPFHSWDVERKG
ncbi:hypothetical protein K1719_001202 [Acacia pycnantha]|nr:hypothetical protein K1719_001202 [Acacia pycnantha]